MPFEWTDGPLELYMRGNIHTDIKFVHYEDNITKIYDNKTQKYLTAVFTSNGDAWMNDDTKVGKTIYVRKRGVSDINNLANISDEDIVSMLREYQDKIDHLHAEIRKRGYEAYDEYGDLWIGDDVLPGDYTDPEDFLSYGQFIKVTTKVL